MLTPSAELVETRVCASCGQERPLTAFNFRNQRKGLRQYYCRDCTRQQVRNHYQAHQQYYVRKARVRSLRIIAEQRAWLRQFLSLHPCVDCGEKDPDCLDFDHVRGKKRCNISLMVGHFAWPKIEAEIAKCEVRCANCHRKITAKRRHAFLPTEAERP
jgi:hypothetical protein